MQHGFFDPEAMGMDDEIIEHLKSEMYDEIQEIGELQHVMSQLQGKTLRRMRKVHQHMQQCSKCLADQIKSGMLIELADYWNLQQHQGGGRYPKIHYQVN